MPSRKQYSDKFRATAVVTLQAAGYPENAFEIERVAEALQVPSRTLRRWYKSENAPPPDDLVTDKKRELVDLFEEVARQYLLHALKVDVLDETRGKDAVISAATAADKVLLLQGKPTQRTETSGKIEHNVGEPSIDRFAEIFDILQDVGAFDAESASTPLDAEDELLHTESP